MAVSSATTSRSFPAVSTSGSVRGRLLLELRGALRHERVALADPLVPLLGHRDDDLAPLLERVRDGAGVADGDRGLAVAVAHPEDVRRPALGPGAGGDL